MISAHRIMFVLYHLRDTARQPYIILVMICEFIIECSYDVWFKKTRMMGLLHGEKIDDMFCCLNIHVGM